MLPELKNTRGVLLAGGRGTRLWPVTEGISKQLAPVYDQPLIYYPMDTLMRMGIRDILIISSPEDIPSITRLLRSGSQWGINLSYAIQDEPKGIAQALIIAESFLNNHSCALILGDNIFLGLNQEDLKNLEDKEGNIDPNLAYLFVARHETPEKYGVLEDSLGRARIVEKPKMPKSNRVVTGLYILPPDAPAVAKDLTPSARGELEITDVNTHYLRVTRAEICNLKDGTLWMDAGNPDDLLKAAIIIQERNNGIGEPYGYPDITSVRQGWTTKRDVQKRILSITSTPAGYADRVLREVRKL